MVHRLRWLGDPYEPDLVVRLPAGAYRLAAAQEAHRVAGLLARAELRGDSVDAARYAAELRALADVLVGPAMPERSLVRGEALAPSAFPARDGARLFAGDAPPLWDGLRPLLAEATHVDVVVAYVTRGGVALVQRELRDALDRGCALRLLTGCYLGGTRPDALHALHALTAHFPQAHVRFVEDPDRHFHPKVYRIVASGGFVSLFVGSSNLSRSALTGAHDALEWNLALDDASAASLLDEARDRLFDGVVAWERSLLEAIGEGWLVPFHYFGVPDPVDYSKLTATRGPTGYRDDELEAAMLRDARTDCVLAALADLRHAGTRSLVFCVSIAHAEHTAKAMRGASMRVACVHSGPGAAARERALGDLRAGRLDAIVAVDVFNEGVDVPEIDRVVLLRPTDSPTVFLQQLGRGLRLHPGKRALTVLDLVGNHRRARARLELLGVSSDDVARTPADAPYARQWNDGREIHLTPEALDAVRAIERAAQGPRARLVAAVQALHVDGGRPSLTTVLSRTGLSTATIVKLFGSWLDLLLVAGVGDAADAQLARSAAAKELLATVESTNLTGPHKMVLLGAMADRGVGRVTVREGAVLFRERIASRHPAVGRYFVNPTTGRSRLDEADSAEIPRRYPMAVLAEAHPSAFALRGEEFSVRQVDDVPIATVFSAMVERTDARLYEFARRRSGHGEVVGKVLGNGDDRLCLMLGPEALACGAIGAWVTLAWESKRYRAKVAKVAINVIHEGDETENVATDVLRRAAGSDTVDDAKGRSLRLRQVEDGIWELELA